MTGKIKVVLPWRISNPLLSFISLGIAIIAGSFAAMPFADWVGDEYIRAVYFSEWLSNSLFAMKPPLDAFVFIPLYIFSYIVSVWFLALAGATIGNSVSLVLAPEAKAPAPKRVNSLLIYLFLGSPLLAMLLSIIRHQLGIHFR